MGKGLSHPNTCIHSPPNSPCIQAATGHWAEFPGLSSRCSLILHVKHSRVSMSIPDSLTVPSPILPPGDHQLITEYWADFPVPDSRCLLILHVKHSRVSMSILPNWPFPLNLPSNRKFVLWICWVSVFFKFLCIISFFLRFHIKGCHTIFPLLSLTSLSRTLSRYTHV